MDEPYIIMEDAPGPDGNIRQFKTKKLRFTDVFGRVCVLGVSSEITDITLIKREFASTKKEYEEAKVNCIIYNHLVQVIRDHNKEAVPSGGVVIACGTAKYSKGDAVADVYKRADDAMFANKAELKEGREVR